MQMQGWFLMLLVLAGCSVSTQQGTTMPAVYAASDTSGTVTPIRVATNNALAPINPSRSPAET
jgi:hypothetical protein